MGVTVTTTKQQQQQQHQSHSQSQSMSPVIGNMPEKGFKDYVNKGKGRSRNRPRKIFSKISIFGKGKKVNNTSIRQQQQPSPASSHNDDSVHFNKKRKLLSSASAPGHIATTMTNSVAFVVTPMILMV